MKRASQLFALSIAFAAMNSCASSTNGDSGAVTDAGATTDSGAVTDTGTDTGTQADSAADSGTLPDGGALGCANGGAPCGAGLMCCAGGLPYPPEGRCQAQCNMISDRAQKEHFAPVDASAALETLARLPITSWSYRAEPGVRHVGPMAQDFHASFGLGGDERLIHPVDANGVTMAAVQALYRRVVALEHANELLLGANRSLERRLRRSVGPMGR